MPGTNTSQQFPFPTTPQVFYCGGNVGLGFPDKECYFSVLSGRVQSDWSIAETLSRLHEFSESAKRRILSDYALQRKYGGKQ